jgi:predicted Zn-dependent protease
MLLSLQARNRKDAGPLLEKALEYLAKARESRKDWAQVPLAEAQIYGQQGRPDLTLRALQEAIELGERNPQAIQQTIALLFQSRRYADADSLLRKLESEQESLSPKLRQLYAESALHQDDPKRALKNARKAVSPDSGDCREQMWLGQMLGILGSQAQARGQTAEAKELIEDAEKALRRAVELEPKLPVVWVSLVQFLSRIGKDDKAKAAIEQARTSIAAKDAPLAIAQCLEIVNESDAAKTEYEAALKAAPQDMITVRTVADFYRRAGKLLPAEALLQKILDGKLQTKDSDLAWARRQLAMILAARGDYPGLQKAQAMIETNLASPEASNEDRQLKARLMAADPTKGKREEAIPIWKQVLQDPSATPEDRLFLVRAYLNAGNWIEASNLLRGLVATNDKDPRFLALYISELLKHNEISSAETYCTRLEEIAPAWFPTVTLRADLLCAADQAHDAFGILKDFVDNVDAIPRERGVRLRLVSDKLAEIGRHMTKPEQASVAAECVALAESLLRTFVKENPGQELVLAVFLGEHGKVDESLDILDDVLQSSKVDDFARACSLVIEAGKCDKKQMQRMSKTIESAMKKFKRVTSLLLSLAELRTYQARYSESIDIYREAIAKTPDNSVALNNLAVLQALQGIDLDESLKLVNQAIEIAGPLGPMLDSRGTVYIAMNNSEKAIEDLTASVNDQDAPPRLFHLAQAYALAGDNAKARTTMDKALKKGLTKESLQPLEWPALEKLRQLPR